MMLAVLLGPLLQGPPCPAGAVVARASEAHGVVVDDAGLAVESGSVRVWTNRGGDCAHGECWRDVREGRLGGAGEFHVADLAPGACAIVVLFERSASQYVVFRRFELAPLENKDLGILRAEGATHRFAVPLVDSQGRDITPFVLADIRETRKDGSWPARSAQIPLGLKSHGSAQNPAIEWSFSRPIGSTITLHGLDAFQEEFELGIEPDPELRGDALEVDMLVHLGSIACRRWNVRLVGEPKLRTGIGNGSKELVTLPIPVAPASVWDIRVEKPPLTAGDRPDNRTFVCLSTNGSGMTRRWSVPSLTRATLLPDIHRFHAVLRADDDPRSAVVAWGYMVVGEVPGGEGPLTWRLDPGVTVAGRAVSRGGSPIGGVHLTATFGELALERQHFPERDRMPLYVAITAADGTFTISGAPQGRELAFERAELPYSESPRVHVPAAGGRIGDIVFD